jgi:transcriptional regulator with XRE-family HTH domain
MSINKSKYSVISGWVKAARKNKKLTQKDLAARLKISKRSLENYESGVVDVPTTTVIGIAKICEYSPTFFDPLIGGQSQNNDTKEGKVVRDEVAGKYISLLEQNVKRLEQENERLMEKLKSPKKSK